MDSEYDRKFEEMKKYIPFLESMIKRLESTRTSGPNPRQAQLDKIRSLRDLLQDKKKRMKMENLLKCEQVLVNLYAKIDQRDTLPGIDNNLPPPPPPPPSMRKADLSLVRNKLKNVVEKCKRHEEETLPEIARASEMEEICTPGSKEPALFQRRPNKQSISPTPSRRSDQKFSSKRNYTRVLVSPHREARSWSKSTDRSPEKLYSRRSPHRSPRKSSPSYKKERKKSSSGQSKKKTRDLNITLDVPEESLASLQTDDIVHRIIKCDDNDVDISTLKKIQAQLLNELQQIGSPCEDLTDLLMKSYKKKKPKAKKEVEEGELSDSESETIDNVYGSLVFVNKDKSNLSEMSTSSNKTEKEPRKIKICLVYNTDKDKAVDSVKPDKQKDTDASDFEIFEKCTTDYARTSKSGLEYSTAIEPANNKSEKLEESNVEKRSISISDSEKPATLSNKNKVDASSKEPLSISKSEPKLQSKDLIALAREQITEIITIDDDDDINKYITKATEDIRKDVTIDDTKNEVPDKKLNKEQNIPPFKPNFYKPLTDTDIEEAKISRENNRNEADVATSETTVVEGSSSREENKEASKTIPSESDNKEINRETKKDTIESEKQQTEIISKEKKNLEIPFIDSESAKETPLPRPVVSEIDILQALKNEILNETIPIPGAEPSTPLLHQPKLTKVACAQEIMNKKRISIEKYKEKAASYTNRPSLFVTSPNENRMKDELSKKQSIKLTEKECERFNLSPKGLDFNESSDEEDKNKPKSPDVDLYETLAPKSPEKEDDCTIQSNPIIIPGEPLKLAVSSQNDVDMRTMLLSPTGSQKLPSPSILPSAAVADTGKNSKNTEPYRPPLVDPRLRVDSSTMNPERTPRPHMFPNMTPSRHPNMTPSRNPNMTPSRNPNMTPSRNPNMTPSSRTFEMTPSHQPFDFEDSSSRKHVYAPFPTFDPRDRETSVSREIHKPSWEPSVDNDTRSSWDSQESRDRNQRASSVHRDNDYQRSRNFYNEKYKHREEYSDRQDCPRTPVHPFGRSECPTTPTPSFGRMDTPLTPVHSFGRSDCPSTPTHPFGRSDLSSHSYGRNECPRTPNHQFGRAEPPTTPNHPFGRGDCSTTPSHPFGRGDHPSTPSHPFGRGDRSNSQSQPFGRSDCPTTPVHPFGRGDCPTTPNHPFGRSETSKPSSHVFGRTEYSHSNTNINQKNVKDPRINRNTEYQSRNPNYNHYQKDRRFTDDRSRDYNLSDSYHNNREQSLGRYEKTCERSGRSHERGNGGSSMHREHMRRDNEDPNRYQKGGSSYYRNEPEGDYQRKSSVSRQSTNEDYNRLSRAPSVGRNYRGEPRAENTLAVKPQTGHSFIIDTSVNRTFQEFLNKKGLQNLDGPSFDTRRQRATSVGRALLPDPPNFLRRDTRAPSVSRMPRESSVGRTLTRVNENFDHNKRDRYMRARSVGRDASEIRHERSLQDIKADFQSYSKRLNVEMPKKLELNVKMPKSLQSCNTKTYKYQQHRNETLDRYDSHHSKQVPKSTYSPRKNYRDPRMQREQSREYKNNSPGKRHGKSYGIVYSHDNIASGTIMGSGYGVKNYKIPKIKRAPEEKTPDEKLETHTATTAKKTHEVNKLGEEKKNENVKSQEKVIKDTNNEQKKKTSIEEKYLSKNKEISAEKSKQAENRKESKIPSTTTKVEIPDREFLVKSRKAKKAIITSDSDSDSDSKIRTPSTQMKELSKNCKEITVLKKSGTKLEGETKNEKDNITPTQQTGKDIKESQKPVEAKEIDKIQVDLLDSSFGIDDLAMFPDNLESDQVMDNINALIADLDNEIEDTKDKGEPFGSELNIEKMIENIHTPTTDSSKEKSDEETLNDIHELIDNLSKTETSNDYVEQSPKHVDLAEKNASINTQTSLSKDDSGNFESNLESISMKTTIENNSVPNDVNKETHNKLDKTNDEIVSTSNNGKQNLTPLNNANENSESLSLIDRSSTPDSTVTANDNVPTSGVVSFPDTTNEGNSDISSTNIPAESSKPTSSHAETDQVISILNSVLKDKSKFQEVYTNTEDEGMKKLLEKIHEMVSNEGKHEGKNDTKNESSTNEPLSVSDNTTTEEMREQTHEIENDQDAKDIKSEKANAKIDESVAINQKSTAGDSKDNLEQEEKVPNTPVSVTPTIPSRKVSKGKRGKRQKKVVSGSAKRVTRSGISNTQKQLKKKPSRELQQLQNDIKEMFISDDVMNATGIRTCRLAKLDEPFVVLEKFNDDEIAGTTGKMGKKKAVSKQKPKDVQVEKDSSENKPKHKPGPKSKTRLQNDDAECAFDSDNDNESKTHQELTTSDSDNDSVTSTKSFESSEALIEVKKKMKRKRGRGGWKSGVIKKKKKKIEKTPPKPVEPSSDDTALIRKEVKIPDMNCFTDKSYCFLKNVSTYSCRLCEYSGNAIVHHYKRDHPHSEIPLSRMSQSVAREAIEQCNMINFQTISKLPTDKYICRFCFLEFGSKRKDNALEGFFWHVVSTHTGEYKQLCSECVNVTRCPFNLDIPPPPKDIKGQLIGYICGKCNFTQISLANLKTHVIVRHNDEQTAVYSINLASMNKKIIQAALKKQSESEPRTLRSSRSNQSFAEASDDRSDFTESTEQISEVESAIPNSVKELPPSSTKKPKGPLKSKIRDTDDSTQIVIKTENGTEEAELHTKIQKDSTNTFKSSLAETASSSRDIIASCPHFKVSYSDTGSKEYVCCINGKDNHYKTTLLISMKKHVQTKHPEMWDGYCSICKVIVTTQGKHNFKECFQHLLDKHIDSFPLMEKIVEEERPNEVEEVAETSETITITSKTITMTTPEIVNPKPYINVRPLSQLLSKDAPPLVTEVLPKINEVMSFSGLDIETALPNSITRTVPIPNVSPTDALRTVPIPNVSPTQTIRTVPIPDVSPTQTLPLNQPQKYEEAQSAIMSQKHQVVLDTMMSHDKLVKIFKCAGKFCYFTSDSLNDSLLHANTHQRIGGENALLCSYCDFDSGGNGISLVTHVFKVHGCCPFVCSKCFYRAVSSQLVRAHSIKIHGEEFANSPILKTNTVTPGTTEATDLLSREVAVAQYFCANVKDVCKFRTYTQGKFTEHLDRHQPPYVCYICSSDFPSPLELITHMKSHGLKLFHCTWCIYGADSDEEFLAHAASCHPNKPPQGYFRVITSQEASKIRVLPLVQYNTVLPTEVVQPSAKENPVREAERALELESLINLVKDTIETPATDVNATSSVTQEPEPVITATLTVEPEQEPRSGTPITFSTNEIFNTGVNFANQLTPVLKSEKVDTPSNKNDSEVILLDSDDEENSRDSQLPTIDLANETNSASDAVPSNSDNDSFKKIHLDFLYRCSLCPLNIYKTLNGFKRHVNSHLVEKCKCAHCPLEFTVKAMLFKHYEEDHRLIETVRDLPERSARPKSMNTDSQSSLYTLIKCSLCDFSDKQSTVKDHMKDVHDCRSTNFITRSRMGGDGNIIYELFAVLPKPTHKRKLPMSSNQPSKKKRFSPEDVHQLPNKPILDELVYCALCEFNSKVRINVVRHLQGHADKQPVAQTVPVNPVPHLETNEKHFDKMVNLASSSLVVSKAPEKPAKAETVPSVRLPHEETLRYPKYVSDRQRHTCGAKGCSYISVDEDMLKCHWETLHGGCHEFHCVHCPPYQQLDTSRPLTAARILVHLRMHDANLYACSSCSYYHYKRDILLKHLNETHKGSGQIMIVREEGMTTSVAPPLSAAAPSAPTMDLKPWQCGLCKYKNMLRQEVVEHCSKVHNSKMQFKCPNCPFRTSTYENVTKHLSHSHPKSKEDVLYYYYREGSISDDPDGTPRWMKQRQKLGIEDAEVKTEVDAPRVTTPVSVPTVNPPPVDLDIVKKEVTDEDLEASTEQLCRKFGAFCDPNGLKYKCPLCKVFNEGTKEAMQAHLFEELKYRKWGCNFCPYKAFHKVGLNDHIQSEHSKQSRGTEQHRAFVELPVDTKVEKWVAELLAHQTKQIENTKMNFARLQQQFEKPCLYQALTSSGSSYGKEPTPTPPAENINTDELIQAFGEFGTSEDLNFCCPKCDFKINDDGKMRDHLESELNRIRWRCSNCNIKFQDYHEAQLHCRTVHFGQSARPVEAMRDPTKRSAWISAVLDTQKSSMPEKAVEEQDASPASVEDSLLVVRYEENVPTPEELMRAARNRADDTSNAETQRANRKRPSSSLATNDVDSDDERLVIDEERTGEKKKSDAKKCPYCDFTSKYTNAAADHVYRHFHLKPFTCAYCPVTLHAYSIAKHVEKFHPNQKVRYSRTPMPEGPPLIINLSTNRNPKKSKTESATPTEDGSKTKEPQVTCLVCESSIPKSKKADHVHPNQTVVFGNRGDFVVKCCNCFSLVSSVDELKKHHVSTHSGAKMDYGFYKLNFDKREVHCCECCGKTYKFFVDLKTHHDNLHKGTELKYTMKPFNPFEDSEEYDGAKEIINLDEDTPTIQKIEEPTTPSKRVAKKSTTKLPNRIVAKKSTTKLPYDVDSDDESEQEYSYYGTKPTSLDELENVFTLMPFCNTTMPFSLKKLSEIIRINPYVLVKDIKK